VSYKDNQSLLKTVDSLPGGRAQWKLIKITFEGTELDTRGQRVKESVELYARNPADCVADLISNPTFNKTISYAPEHHIVAEDSGVSTNGGEGSDESSEEGDDEASNGVEDEYDEEVERIYDEMCTSEWWHRIQV
jgi:hypothetical protein